MERQGIRIAEAILKNKAEVFPIPVVSLARKETVFRNKNGPHLLLSPASSQSLGRQLASQPTRSGESGGPGEGVKARCQFHTPCPVHFFHLAVPEFNLL